MPQQTNIPSDGQTAHDAADFYQKPDFPQLYFKSRKGRKPAKDDDNEVFALAFEIMDKLSSNPSGLDG